MSFCDRIDHHNLSLLSSAFGPPWHYNTKPIEDITIESMTIRLLLLLSLFITPVLCKTIYTLEEVHGLSDFLRGGDKRLVRDKPHQGSFLRTGTFCEGLDSYIHTIQHSTDTEAKYYAADALTTCLIHRRDNQDAAGMNPHFHEVVVNYLREEPHVAAELIWAATENNSINLNGFIEKNAVEELFRVIQYYEYSVAAMWSAAALMNMSTSYCGDAACVWKWNDQKKLKTTHTVDVNGLVALLHILELEGLYDLLLDQVCSSAAFTDIHGIVLPSLAVKPVDVGSLVPWAMAGLIKTLALRKSSHAQLEAAVPCLCILSQSDDPLERRQAWEALYHLGRERACHTEDARQSVCVDMPFTTKDDISCADLESPNECHDKKDKSLSAKEACCICGGGDTMVNSFGPEESGDDL